jgi:hypothetical protein
VVLEIDDEEVGARPGGGEAGLVRQRGVPPAKTG